MKKNSKKVGKKSYTDIWVCIKNKTTNINTPCAFKQFCTKTGPQPHLFYVTADEKTKKMLCFPFKDKEKQIKKNRKKVDKKVDTNIWDCIKKQLKQTN